MEICRFSLLLSVKSYPTLFGENDITKIMLFWAAQTENYPARSPKVFLTHIVKTRL